ncbi:hypothetical protein [Phenylobacterium sp. SCN 70-31]|uniref:alpha/beta fold hydrolase n=1 Tax=Phenylobacterium sp. SCN 70-31 TaxID=1660129 RepID=UPI000868DCB6|nr:hypothetical protein [Phenylobacterium sp. SCN 70-31]ODT85166.1 MAG: hypothetical protein ABS78_21545 [Phenylobacterium sp. SCN 70-31]
MRRPRGAALAAALAPLLLLAGCATAPPAPEGWTVRDVTAGGHLLAAATPSAQRPGSVLTVVIEGDGPAHDPAGRPSADPTPRRPVGLAIAKAWPTGPVAWLARPCQFTRARDPACRPETWSRDRFGPAAFAALDAGVDALKAATGARQVRLVGWSGGGTMAAALTAARDDVAGLVTFAAPLDIDHWTTARGLSPLPQAEAVRGLGSARSPVPQVHLLGARDRTVRPGEGLETARRLGVEAQVADEAHDCCWPHRVGEAVAALERQARP